MDVNFTNDLEPAIKYLCTQGAFLTTKFEDKINLMTISWGSVGFQWNKPIFTVLIRKSRYTHELIEKSKEFTVSIPLNENMKNALLYCGTKSGKHVDKINECNLTLENSKFINTPIISGCEFYYECKIFFKQEMDINHFPDELKTNNYHTNDYHTFYFGEIVCTYKK